MHWKSGFYKQIQCNYVHSDEDCDIHLQGKKCMYSKCRDMQGQNRAHIDRQGETRTGRDRQGQTWTDSRVHHGIHKKSQTHILKNADVYFNRF